MKVRKESLIGSLENAIGARLRSFHGAYQSIERADPFSETLQVLFISSQTSFRYFNMRCLRFLRRLLGKGRRHHRDHDKEEPKAAILQLSLDILFLITDNLALHDKFLLSHTCKALRLVTFQDWDIEISRLSFNDKIGFWAGLAYTSPNHWVCPKCCKLHLIDTSDVPAAYWTVRERGDPCNDALDRGIEIEGYSIQHHHIQFALKLSRLGSVHQQYLAALMDTYIRTGGISLIPPLAESNAAEPRIIDKRFILREEWNISNNTSTALQLFPDDPDLHISVCPHMRMMYGGPASSRSGKESFVYWIVHISNNNSMRQFEESILLKEVTLLEDGIALAYESPGQWIFNSCLHCPTDFGIMISTDEREATIRAWHDFGIEGSPMDISWRAHVADENTHWLDVGPYLDYTHGSIRESWLEGISHGTGTSQAKLRSFFTKLIA